MSEWSQAAKALLDAERSGPLPSPERIASIQAAIATRVQVPTHASAARVASTAKTGGLGAAAAKVVIVALVAGGLVVKARDAVHRQAEPARVAHTQRAPRVLAPSRELPMAAPPEVVQPAVAPERIAVTEVPVTPVAAAVRRHRVASERAGTAAERRVAPVAVAVVELVRGGSLADETAMLRAAQTALGAGDAARALMLVDQYAARFPDGLMREEQRVARITALCALGRADEARAAVREFTGLYPRSAYLARLRSACAGVARASGESGHD